MSADSYYHPCCPWAIGRGTVPVWVNLFIEYISGDIFSYE